MIGFFVGLTTIDIQFFTDSFPLPNTKVKTLPPDILVGGPAANAAVAFSFLGAKARFFSSVGTNPFSDFILNDFKNTGIEFEDLSSNQNTQPVFASVITTANGDRTILSHHPENIDIQNSVEDWFNEQTPDFVFIDGFYPFVAEKFAKEAQLRKIPVIFDGGSWKPALSNLLPFVDIAICSANFSPPNCTNDYQSVFNFLKKQGIKFSAITRGEKSVVACYENNVVNIDVAHIDAVDTLGAGDFFHGAFCYYYTQLNNWLQALYKSAQLATLTCQYKGTRKWLKQINKETFL